MLWKCVALSEFGLYFLEELHRKLITFAHTKYGRRCNSSSDGSYALVIGRTDFYMYIHTKKLRSAARKYISK